MAKFIMIYIVEALLTLTFITQVLVPMFIKNLKLFWLFRPPYIGVEKTDLEKDEEKANKL